MLTTITTAATVIGGPACVALAIWRPGRKPPGQWMAMAVIAATLAVLNAFDAATNHTGLSWLVAVMWTVGTIITLLGARHAWARAEAEAYLSSLRTPGGPR